MRKLALLGLALLIASLYAAERRGVVTVRDPASRAGGDARRGRALVERFECNRCHEGAGVGAQPLSRRCVGCHQAIFAGSYPAPADAIARWQADIVHFRDAPSLGALGHRLRPEWIERYLTDPYPLRPALEAEMPRLPLSAEQARDMVAWLSRSSDGAPGELRGDPARGRQRFGELGCARCHAFTGAPASADGPVSTALRIDDFARARRLAPDLRHARDRWRPSRVAQQLVDPRALDPDAVMPAFGLSEQDARDVAVWVMRAPLAPPQRPFAFVRRPPLQRPVAWAEVASRVFRRACWHCHSDADFARGESGAGNRGGFGFAPRGIDLSSYEGARSGMIARDGTRVSLLAPDSDGMSPLLRSLLARHDERRGTPREGARGMPLGMSPLDAEEIQLVETWIAQGAPEDIE